MRPVPRGLYLQGIVVVVCLLWFRLYPPIPTVAIGFVGVVAAIMAIRADKFSPVERVMWVVICFSLFVVEMKAIYRDRKEFADRQAELRREEKKDFESVLQQNQRHFDETLSKMEGIAKLSSGALVLSNKALNQITGGGQFCWLMAVPLGEEQFPLAAMNSGNLPLERCRVVIRKADHSSKMEEYTNLLHPLWVEELGPLAPIKDGGPQTKIMLPIGSYSIDIQTRNDRFIESLTIEPKSQGFATVEVRDLKHRLLYASPEVQKKKSK